MRCVLWMCGILFKHFISSLRTRFVLERSEAGSVTPVGFNKKNIKKYGLIQAKAVGAS